VDMQAAAAAAAAWKNLKHPILRYTLPGVILLVLYSIFSFVPILRFAAALAFVVWVFLGASGRYRTIAIISSAPVFLLNACDTTVATARYRLFFEVQSDGVVKSASSVIQLNYHWSTSVSGNPIISPRATGIAPVVDLGSNGTLVLAIDTPRLGVKWLQLPCVKKSAFIPAYFFESAYSVHVNDESLFEYLFQGLAGRIWWLSGKRELAQGMQAFIWFPENASFDEGKYLCADEFERVIGGNLALRSVAIEIAPRAPIKSKLDIQARWLEQLRNGLPFKKYKGIQFSRDPERPFVPDLSQLEQAN
jgi:hypothetical protein